MDDTGPDPTCCARWNGGRFPPLSLALRPGGPLLPDVTDPELEGEEGEREAAAYGASVTEWRSVKVSATRRVLRRHSQAPGLKLVLRA